MIRRIKSYGDSSNRCMINHYPSIDKKNYIIFSMLCMHFENDYVKVFSVLQNLFHNKFLHTNDLLEFKNFALTQTHKHKLLTTSPEQNDDYIYMNKIGTGSFGQVFQVIHKIDEQMYALKKINLKEITFSTESFDEIKTLAVLNHPNIVRYYHSFLKEHYLYIQMEYCTCNLKEKMTQSSLSEENKEKIVEQIISGITYLHSQNYIHFDLKPDNILFDNAENVKICDFGFAKHFSKYLDESFVAHNIYAPPNITSIDYNIDWYSVCIMIIELYLPQFTTNMEKVLTIQNTLSKGNFSFPFQSASVTERVQELFSIPPIVEHSHNIS